MTISLSIKVNDGLILAADSATTMMNQNQVLNIYDNANKVFNLYKGLPLGAITWGLGNIGKSSIATLVKDFRKRLMEDKEFDDEKYSVQEVATRFYEFAYLDKYKTEVAQSSYLGFIIGGYSPNNDQPELWSFEIGENGDCSGPQLLKGTDDSGLSWAGQQEAINRLVNGYDAQLRNILNYVQLDPHVVDQIMGHCNNALGAQVVTPAMPIQDAIDIAEFLIQTTINYVKYTPGHQTVGGPIEIAAITKHEGFKWIKRKHYYNSAQNPKED